MSIESIYANEGLTQECDTETKSYASSLSTQGRTALLHKIDGEQDRLLTGTSYVAKIRSTKSKLAKADLHRFQAFALFSKQYNSIALAHLLTLLSKVAIGSLRQQ